LTWLRLPALLLAWAVTGGCMPPSWGAAALLHPSRRRPEKIPTRPFESVHFDGEGVRLEGWWFHGAGRGAIIYLHGVADNRDSGIRIAEHYVPQGFDVIAYDSRGHGESTGDSCTYGFHEKRDLARVIDHITARPIVLLGSSLGAAVSLQAAAEDDRIAAVVAVATFSDLRTVASERAPFFASKSNVAEAFRIAEATAHFRADEVSPVAAAARIRVPVMLVHGEADRETPPAHSQRVFAALRGPSKRLLLVPGAGHNDALSGSAWSEVDRWLEAVLKRQ
jgi:pimeloyl-ACP methyl ester carboxylesterase